MCGIMAYIGPNEAYPTLIYGLKKLEYRGYDSCGVAIMNGSLSLLKKEGKVAHLEDFAKDKKTDGNIGLGHTRWATHGIPSDVNSHPHQSQSRRYTLVHNGIIENHEELRNSLKGYGYSFQSDTDSEVLVQMIQWQQYKYNISTKEALSRSLQLVEGSFAIVLFDIDNPTKLWGAKRKSPLVLGLGKGENLIASDIMPMAHKVSEALYLKDDMIVELNDQADYECYDLNLDPIDMKVEKVSLRESNVSKGKYESFMLKEIYDQPISLKRLRSNYGPYRGKKDFNRIIITACGTSMYSGLFAKNLIEDLVRIPVSVEYASEFRYANPILNRDELVIGISQSGETADTIGALELAKDSGCATLAVVNVKNSTIDRMCDHSIHIHAGAEIGVASTKAFTNQVVALCLFLAEMLTQNNNGCSHKLIKEIDMMPRLMTQLLHDLDVDEIVDVISEATSALYLGRGSLFPVALEGALKLKEVTYIHSEGYAAGEMKHGPIALVDEKLPIIALVQNDHQLPKIISNIQEVKAREGKVIIIKEKGIVLPENLADHAVEVSDELHYLTPLLMNIPLQIIAHNVAVVLGRDVDKPRNLAKSVTVE